LAKAPAGGAPFISPDLEKADVAATAKSGYIDRRERQRGRG
jgi:hypothetical protein